MKMITRTLAAFVLAAALPLAASAQSSLDTSQAQAFLGSWSASFESPQGELVLDVVITDRSGKVAASIGAEIMGGMQDVTNISRSGDNLVLRYEIDAQGQMAPVALTLAPDGAALNATMDFADGMFVMEGRATK
jgi:carbohydrate-selective porin OprB